MNIIAVLLIIPAAIIKLLLVLLGLIMVPVALMFNKWPPFAWLWGNDEDGVPDWWLARAKDKHIVARTFPRWWWYAIRNPVNNLRFLFDDVTPDKLHIRTNWNAEGWAMEAPQMQEVGQHTAWRFVRHGWKAGYRRVWLDRDTYSEIWFGWKLASPVPGLGFAMQVRLNRTIGQ